MNEIVRPYAVLALALALCATGCTKSDNASSDATSSPAATAAASDAASPDATAEASASAEPTAIASSTGTPAAALTDISGVNGEKEITQLAQLGVVDPTTGTFDPGKSIDRRTFIRWLAKSNNVLWSDTPAKRVKLADKTETSAFTDVATTDPDFPYIQGMQDAGYSVGFPDKTFKPDGILTREQMFAIKNVFDRGSVDAGLAKGLDFARNTAMAPWKDKQSISKTYVAAIASGSAGGNDSFGLVYGASSLFLPQKPVTRAEAAVLVSVMGDHTFYGGAKRTAAQAAALPSPSPTP